MKNTSNRGAMFLLRRLTAVGLVVAIAAFTITWGVGTARSSDSAASNVVPADTERPAQAITGRLIRVEDEVYTVRDAEGEHSFFVGPTTQVVRGIERSLVIDNDLSRVRLNDSLVVSAEIDAAGDLMARTITANGFVTHNGIIEARGAGFIDVQQTSKLDGAIGDESLRVWLSPAARVVWLDPGGRRSMGYFTDLVVGRKVAFQGFLADDGTWVATLLYPSRL